MWLKKFERGKGEEPMKQSLGTEILVPVILLDEKNNNSAQVEALFDTGANYCQVPADLATCLAIKVLEETEIELANGSKDRLPMGLCNISIKANNESVFLEGVPVLVGPANSQPIVGMDLIRLFNIQIKGGQITQFDIKKEELSKLQNWNKPYDFKKALKAPGAAARAPELPHGWPKKKQFETPKGPGAPVKPIPPLKPVGPK